MPTTKRFSLKGMIAGAGAAGLPGLAAVHSTSDSLVSTAAESALAGDATTPPIEFTRGIGIYPGNPSENFGPEFIADASTYRNLALNRAAYHSSSYDYNLTAQLVTDGIKHDRLPNWVSTSAGNLGAFPKNEREAFLDHYRSSFAELRGPRASVQIEIGGGRGSYLGTT